MIPVAEPELGNEELNNVIAAFKSGWISSKGAFIPQFEKKFARYCGVRHGVSTFNGTAALHLALTALGIGPGDEVIVPSLTFIATANAVAYCGAKPVMVDVHPDYWCIDPQRIEEAITPRTKALIPVHLYGHPCDMDAIMAIARRHRLLVVEDAAEAHGAECRGRKVGSFGQVSCFSFYGNKIITTGEGGICITGNKRLADTMRCLRDHGMSTARRYWHTVVGFNYRMTNLQAAVGVAQLEKIDAFIEKKRAIARAYRNALRTLSEAGSVRLHPEMDWARCVYWMYSILVEQKLGMSRDRVMAVLGKKKIESRPFFYPLHIQPPYRNGTRFPVAERLSKKGICLPSSVSLDEKTIIRIASFIGN